MNEFTKDLQQQIATSIAQPTPVDTPQFFSEDSPFDQQQRDWLNGLFTGLYAVAASAKSGANDAPAGTALKILYGSQSGTSESLSKDLKKFAATQGYEGEIAELDSITPADLAGVQHAVIIAATFGEGEPTDNAVNFYKALMADDAPALPASLNFSVCGMGDSSYPHFNKASRDIDARLAELGATRVAPLVACDVDYDDDYAQWRGEVFESEPFKAAAGGATVSNEPEEAKPEFDKNHPFLANLVTAYCLSGEKSAKRVNHVEISLAGGGPDLDYDVGDALGLWPLNCMTEVDAILAKTGFTGKEIVDLKTGPMQLRLALYKMLDLMTVTSAVAESWGVEGGTDIHLIDILDAGVKDLTPQILVDGLRPLQPRLYSISSSPKKHPGEVHLTVGEVHYELHGTKRKGCASTYLGHRLGAGGAVGVYMQKSAHFHIPSDDDSPLIMIGPGTGIAPFRAFLEEREMRGAKGKNWLFFGDQHEATDYLYRDEISAWQEIGLLTNLSLAWSRDGDEKVYVQHLIERSGEEFFAWLEEGGAIYICGDASRMAADVDKAIRSVASKQLGSEEAGDEYVENLKKTHRYQRDVY
ncbi:MAG: flavodoxin domain-containing protein [Pseudomonadota bacterium]